MNIFIKTSALTKVRSESEATKILNYGLGRIEFQRFNFFSPSELLEWSLECVLEPPKISVPENIVAIDPSANDLKPLVYIYNTHESETYDSSFLNAYNISYNVKIASYILRDYLRENGIPSYVEPESMSSYLKENGLLYKDSYEASRYYIKKRKEEYPSILVTIDLHRDSVGAEATTAFIDGKNYAKVMFVVGLKYEQYATRLAFAEKIENMLDERISRGILKKEGAGVNGIYNQDLTEKSLLLEVGGIDNNIDEVNNTMKVVARAIFEYMKGNE